MAKKPPLTPEEVTELFAQLDDSGVIDPNRARRKTDRTIDPLSGDDPSGSKVDNAISRVAMAVIIGVLVIVLGMQVWYGVNRRLNTANLSDTVNPQTVSSALEGGVEWGNGFTQFPSTFTVNAADERSGRGGGERGRHRFRQRAAAVLQQPDSGRRAGDQRASERQHQPGGIQRFRQAG